MCHYCSRGFWSGCPLTALARRRSTGRTQPPSARSASCILTPRWPLPRHPPRLHPLTVCWMLPLPAGGSLVSCSRHVGLLSPAPARWVPLSPAPNGWVHCLLLPLCGFPASRSRHVGPLSRSRHPNPGGNRMSVKHKTNLAVRGLDHLTTYGLRYPVMHTHDFILQAINSVHGLACAQEEYCTLMYILCTVMCKLSKEC